jgi:hypothetical protein
MSWFKRRKRASPPAPAQLVSRARARRALEGASSQPPARHHPDLCREARQGQQGKGSAPPSLFGAPKPAPLALKVRSTVGEQATDRSRRPRMSKLTNLLWGVVGCSSCRARARVGAAAIEAWPSAPGTRKVARRQPDSSGSRSYRLGLRLRVGGQDLDSRRAGAVAAAVEEGHQAAPPAATLSPCSRASCPARTVARGRRWRSRTGS